MSGRIRTIKPEWLEDELLAAASDEARVLSVALILMADDYGRGRASAASIAAGAWRYQLEREDGEQARETLARASRALRELLAIRFVAVYEVAGQRYFEIRNWNRHQKVDRPSKPRIPEPPAGIHEQNRDRAEPSRDTRESLARPSENTRETLATDLRPVPPTTDLRPASVDPPARAPARVADPVPMAEERASLSAFDARCAALVETIAAACREVRRQPPPPACSHQSREVTDIARWLGTAGEVDVSGMVGRWAAARSRDGRWAPLSWLARDPTEYAFPAPTAASVPLTAEQEDESVRSFIEAGTRAAGRVA